MKKGKSLSIKAKVAVFMTLLLSSVLVATFIISYSAAKKEIISINEEMFMKVIKDTIGFMEAMNDQVEKGSITLDEAKEIVRNHVLGPLKADNTRDLSKSKMSSTDYIYVWAFTSKGVLAMHPMLEGVNAWDSDVQGKKTTRDTWANTKLSGRVVRDIWQNPNEPVTTFVAYQQYYEPWDWMIGSGARQKALYAKRLSGMRNSFIITAVLVFLISMGFSTLFISSRVAGPLKDAGRMLKDISEGEWDLTRRLSVRANDEIGEFVGWYNVFIEKIQKMVKNISANAETLDASSSDLLAVSRVMSEGADETSGKTGSVTAAAEQMAQNINTFANAVEEASSNVTMVAGAAEEMTATINEIAVNSEKARGITGEAVNQSNTASKSVKELGHAAQEINKVTDVITEISEQTNLLALNATIEAARAGEAGKGFAVVANEIKELARQTAEATSEINRHIEGIQGTTKNTVSGIEVISKVIHEVDEIVSTIATAVEEQSVTSKEIAENISNASRGIVQVNDNIAGSSEMVRRIARDISGVNQSAAQISGSGSKVNVNAEEMARLSEQLREMMTGFKV